MVLDEYDIALHNWRIAMSQQANRYHCDNRKLGSLRRMTKHHQPPEHPDSEPRTINVDERHHRAFHLIFGNPMDIQTCLSILKRDWFNPAKTP